MANSIIKPVGNMKYVGTFQVPAGSVGSFEYKNGTVIIGVVNTVGILVISDKTHYNLLNPSNMTITEVTDTVFKIQNGASHTGYLNVYSPV